MLPIQEIFTLLFSILYGIMLNSLLGLGAFPIGNAFDLKDVFKRDIDGTPRYIRGYRSFKRFWLAFFTINLLPFLYFAFLFLNLPNWLGNIISSVPVNAILQILTICLFSLSVFAFYRLFLALIVYRPNNPIFYTNYELNRINKRRAIYLGSKSHAIGAILYALLPWLFVAVLSLSGIFPIVDC